MTVGMVGNLLSIVVLVSYKLDGQKHRTKGTLLIVLQALGPMYQSAKLHINICKKRNLFCYKVTPKLPIGIKDSLIFNELME